MRDCPFKKDSCGRVDSGDVIGTKQQPTDELQRTKEHTKADNRLRPNLRPLVSLGGCHWWHSGWHSGAGGCGLQRLEKREKARSLGGRKDLFGRICTLGRTAADMHASPRDTWHKHATYIHRECEEDPAKTIERQLPCPATANTVQLRRAQGNVPAGL